MLGLAFVIGNLLIATSFTVEGLSLLWLWRGWGENPQRRKAALMIALVLLACACSRYSYAAIGIHKTPLAIVLLDWVTGVTALTCAVPMPWIVAAIRRMPTADQVAAAARVREAELLADARVEREKQATQQAQQEAARRGRQLVQLGLILQATPGIPEDMKDRITRLIGEVE